MHSSLSQMWTPIIVLTPQSVKMLFDTDNATYILSFKKLSERVSKVNWFKIESMGKDVHKDLWVGSKMAGSSISAPTALWVFQ